MAIPLRFAICNEIFGLEPFDQVCKQVHELGYSGIELAPHTLREDATTLTQSERRDLCSQMREAELDFVGLHWLLVSPPGLHITTSDPTVRTRTWEYVHRAI